jgi:hypothetical protein
MALADRDYAYNWPAVQAEADALYDQRKWNPYFKVVSKAIAATSNPAAKSIEDLEIIANYHDQLTNGACDCRVCLELARRTGTLS